MKYKEMPVLLEHYQNKAVFRTLSSFRIPYKADKSRADYMLVCSYKVTQYNL